MFDTPPPRASGVEENPPAGWLPAPFVPGALRWWDGTQWTDQVITPGPKPRSERFDRFWAAASHVGTFCGGPLTPLIVWSASPTGSLRRSHARQAFAYQMVYLPVYVLVLVKELVFANRVESVFICVGIGVALTVPQMIRAAIGKPPWPVPPFFRLRE